MTFQDLFDYIEIHGCTIDPYIEDSYWAYNSLNQQGCVIENLPVYGTVALCHYFFELGIPAPRNIRADCTTYRNLIAEEREDIPN